MTSSIASGRLCELFGGFVIYRSLVPVDDRLPTFNELKSELGMETGQLPRKAEPSYAGIVGRILTEARSLSGITTDVSGLLFVGDTMHNDVSAFSNLCRTMKWAGRAFIGNEGAKAVRDVRQLAERQSVTISDQWADITSFAADALASGLGGDEGTVVVVDIDKTLLGARGRNDHMIDWARQRAAYEVALDVCGENLVDESQFRRIYDTINSPDFHALTEDNQDAIAYTSLLVACGFIQLDELAAAVVGGQICGLRAFVADVQKNAACLPDGVAKLHGSVREQVGAGNPTPFVAFRQAEYRCTVALMGCLPDDVERRLMLEQEIVITEEVWKAVSAWKAHGCVIFGLSDKPDEACFPPPDHDDTNGLPVHEMRTHIIGGRRCSMP